MLEHITPFVDGELSEQEAVEVEGRMERDPQYRHLIDSERAIKRLLTTRMTRHTAPPAFETRLRAALFADPLPANHDVRPAWRSVRGLFTQSPAFATALGSVLLVIALTAVLLLTGGQRVTPFVQDVFAHHTETEHFAVNITGGYESVASDTAKAVGFTVPVPNLGDDLSLLGARKCYLCGHLMAFVKYSADQGLVTFFVVPKVSPAIQRLDKQTAGGMAFYTTTHKQVRMAFWHNNGVMYCLATQATEERMLDLAAKACRQTHTIATIAHKPAPHTHLALAGIAH